MRTTNKIVDFCLNFICRVATLFATLTIPFETMTRNIGKIQIKYLRLVSSIMGLIKYGTTKKNAMGKLNHNISSNVSVRVTPVQSKNGNLDQQNIEYHNSTIYRFNLFKFTELIFNSPYPNRAKAWRFFRLLRRNKTFVEINRISVLYIEIIKNIINK